MLELAVLGLLKERSMHGYQLKKRLSDTLGGFWQVSYGSLYPALKRLQRDGAVEMVFSKEEVGRRKNVYRTTPKGEALFTSLLEETGAEASEDKFRVRLAFFRYLRPETRIGVLERRRAYLQARLAQLERSFADYQERTDGYTLSLMRHGLDATEHDIRWLDGLIEAERRNARSTGPSRRTTRTTRTTRTRASRTGRAPAPSPVPQKENV
ncbi:MAG: PadR family transcriptional regulator [Actinomycetota bacterium]